MKFQNKKTAAFIGLVMMGIGMTSCRDSYVTALCTPKNRQSLFTSNHEYRIKPESNNPAINIEFKHNEDANNYLITLTRFDSDERISLDISFCEIGGKTYTEISSSKSNSHGLYTLEMSSWVTEPINQALSEVRNISLKRVFFNEDKLRSFGIDYIKTFKSGRTLINILNSESQTERLLESIDQNLQGGEIKIEEIKRLH